ncbi:MAG: hypothetical protein K8R25_11425 [Methanosarcinales archaeon]|nr:hypothetical protein [Methanosarcinales archaeon]
MANKTVLSKVLEIMELGKPDMSTFDNRIRLQKIIYLLQSSGMSMGYGYNWYVKGPYSSPLTHDLYEIAESTEIYENNENIKFKDHEKIVSNLEKFRVFLGEYADNVKYLEVFTSIHYINEAMFSGKGDQARLKDKLLEAKPSLGDTPNIDDIISKAYEKLQTFSKI